MKKNLMLILIFSLGLFVFCPSVFASNNLITTDIADSVINYYKDNLSTISNNTYSTYVGNQTNMKNYFDSINREDFCNIFNTYLNTIEESLSVNNILFAGGWSGNGGFTIAMIVSKNSTENENLDYAKVYMYSPFSGAYQLFMQPHGTGNIYRYKLQIGTQGTLTDESFGDWGDIALYKGNAYSTIEPSLVSIGIDYLIYDKDNIEKQVANNLDFSDSPSGDAGTYYNYDYNEYFIRPYIKIETINGLTQYLADSYTIPFSVYSQSGDEYYPFDSLKMDLRVLKSVTDYSGENLETHFVSMVDSYKRFSGNFADTTGYSDFITNGNILRYNYNLKDKFDSTFVNQYLNDATNKEQYAFQLVLYDFWGDVLSMSDVFYFYDANNLNNKPLIDAWGGDNTINSSFDSTNTADFSSLVKTFTDFMSTIMSFWSFLPGWLIALLTLRVTSAIAIRMLGR